MPCSKASLSRFYQAFVLHSLSVPNQEGGVDNEKVHLIQHCGIETTSLANPLNARAEGPEGGHKLWIKGQGVDTNQGPEAAWTMLQHSINKEAAQLLCKAVQTRADDGNESDD